MTTVQKLLLSVFSPPRPIREPKDEDHHKHSTKPDPAALEAQRCPFTFSDGRQCRNQQAQFCVHHASKRQRDPSANDFPDPPDAALVECA
jgi:hypothetical protein